jgi:hypothetical protein
MRRCSITHGQAYGWSAVVYSSVLVIFLLVLAAGTLFMATDFVQKTLSLEISFLAIVALWGIVTLCGLPTARWASDRVLSFLKAHHVS